MYKISAYRYFSRKRFRDGSSDADLPFLQRRRALDQTNYDLEQKRKAIERAIAAGTPPPILTNTEVAFGRAILLCDWLYAILNTLDSKASALMRLNGVMVAAATFLHQQNSGFAASIALAISSVASTLSIACCLSVVSLDWPFYHYVKMDANNSPDPTEELFHLQRVTIFREKMYRYGWALSSIGILSFFFCLYFAFSPMFSSNGSSKTQAPSTHQAAKDSNSSAK